MNLLGEEVRKANNLILKGFNMKSRFGMKRPFDIGTFPKVELVGVENTDRRETGFYAIVETVEPLSYDDIDNFELCVLDENNNVIYKYCGERK